MENNQNIKNDLDKYLTTEKGIEEAEKVLPLLLGGFVNNTEANISDLSQQSVVLIDSLQKLSEMYAQSTQQTEDRLAKIEQALNINSAPQSQPQAAGQIQPTQPMGNQGGELGDLSNLLQQLKGSQQQ